MDLEGYYSLWNLSYREMQVQYDMPYMWNLENKEN